MTAAISDAVIDALADLLQVPRSALSVASSPIDVPAWDSVQHLNLILVLEDRFGIAFEPEEIGTAESIGALADVIARKLSAH